MRDVAQEAGVSTATVSRVLSGRGEVRPGTRERVETAAEKLDYRPNAVARSLREQNTRTLGLIIPNLRNPFFTEVARAVEDAAREGGYSLMLGNTDEDPDKEAEYLDVLTEKRVNGLIVSPARASVPRLEALARDRLPVIFLDRYVWDIEAPVIRADGRRAVDELVGYLVGLGHERLGIISGPPETVPGRERLDAFLGSVEARGLPVGERYIKVGNFRRESGLRAMHELLELSEPPTAIFAANNLMALGALQALKRSGVAVPDDISFASFDDVSWFELAAPPVTAIAQPVGELGAVAAGALLELVEGKEPESMILEASLVVRGSCGRPR